MIFQFGIPTKTLFGVGQLNHLHEQMMPGKKALLILSNGISAKKYGYSTLQLLRSLGSCQSQFTQGLN